MRLGFQALSVKSCHLPVVLTYRIMFNLVVGSSDSEAQGGQDVRSFLQPFPSGRLLNRPGMHSRHCTLHRLNGATPHTWQIGRISFPVDSHEYVSHTCQRATTIP